jgi:hypothetical protein
MAMYPLRVRFSSANRAYELFSSFPPQDVDWIEGHSRKRHGDSQVMLLHLSSECGLQDFFKLCNQHPDIVEVLPITQEEFESAPSNAI